MIVFEHLLLAYCVFTNKNLPIIHSSKLQILTQRIWAHAVCEKRKQFAPRHVSHGRPIYCCAFKRTLYSLLTITFILLTRIWDYYHVEDSDCMKQKWKSPVCFFRQPVYHKSYASCLIIEANFETAFFHRCVLKISWKKIPKLTSNIFTW